MRPVLHGCTDVLFISWSRTLIKLRRKTEPRMIASLRKSPRFFPGILLFFAFSFPVSVLHAQDWVRTGSGLGSQRIRLAAADFKPVGGDPQTPQLKTVFDATLYNDLSNAGVFDIVSKSM